MMKSIVATGPGTSDFKETNSSRPQMKNGEVLIKISAVSFNPIDYQMRRGMSEAKLQTSSILGRECSGIIAEIGFGVTNLNIGDQVLSYTGSLASNGTYAEYVSVPSLLVHKIPENCSLEIAAAIPLVGLTAYQIFERLSKLPISSAPSIFITGAAGGVGSFLIPLLKHLPFNTKKIICTYGNESSRNHLVGLGINPENLIDYRNPDYPKKIMDANDGHLFDIAVDLVGNAAGEIAANVLKVFGTYVDVTYFLSEKLRETLFDRACNIMHVANYAKTLKLLDSSHSPLDLNWYQERLHLLVEWANQGRIPLPQITVVGPFDPKTVILAHEIMEQNQTKGKKLVMAGSVP